MLFRIELRTDDPELIGILDGVRNRAKFVKKAVRYFVSTRQGKEVFRVMSKSEIKNLGKGTMKRKKPEKTGPLPSDWKKGDYDLDRFL